MFIAIFKDKADFPTPEAAPIDISSPLPKPLVFLSMTAIFVLYFFSLNIPFTVPLISAKSIQSREPLI